MKILYLVPKINNEGGVSRVLSLKASYLVSEFGYEVHILTQNEGNNPLFYDFDRRVCLHDIKLYGNALQFIENYRKCLKQKIREIQPDIVLVCDNGLKAFLIPFILKTNIPIVFESHGSKFIEEQSSEHGIVSRVLNSLKYRFKGYAAGKFSRLVALSQENLLEWNVKNGVVIPNPNWIKSTKASDLKSKQVIAVGRHVYEKGFDRLLEIWQKVVQKHPDWKLVIYGKTNREMDLAGLAEKLGITNNVAFNEPVRDIDNKYREASFLLMTSRSEGFGMVIIEAMTCGLSVIAYDCPCGPGSIIQDGRNGFLIEDRNAELFVNKITQLIENENLRIEMGQRAQRSVQKYDLATVMQQWKGFLESVVKSLSVQKLI